MSKVRNELDMLEGNLNRMFTCETFEELQKMHAWAWKRLGTIERAINEAYDINEKRFEIPPGTVVGE